MATHRSVGFCHLGSGGLEIGRSKTEMDIAWNKHQEERRDVAEVARDFNCECGAL
jgi:hypothetical protein